MKISGFTMAKNASKLYYPIKQSIESILPIVDEFIVVLGDNDIDDVSEKLILSLNSEKIKIYHTTWDIKKYPRGMEHAHQTDIAKEYCTGDWLFYLQADEVIHEKYLPIIKLNCQKYLDDSEVEGFLFEYNHFWGDYWHKQFFHGWYLREIRIVRNSPEIHSWQSAQSFRKIPSFDGISYRQKEGTYKLKVINSGAKVYHYGWVRPPHLMINKQNAFRKNHSRTTFMEEKEFDYGPLDRMKCFKGTHPKVMSGWISEFNWKNKLFYSKKEYSKSSDTIKHETFKIRFITFLEQFFLCGRKHIGAFHNYILLKK